MSADKPLPIAIQILLLQQKMAQQRYLIHQQFGSQQQDNDQFPRSLCMKLLQQKLADLAPSSVLLTNKLQGKGTALLWSFALT
ncbi:hypothetical protein WH43_12705 [Rheinheimera sp. KL1]|uniref:hypothetical protein n=1 Tax=Rheinheimera sp. KL1 TaxID=1635005 RepID=UPI0006A95198|nr:hypothetical protein [Rheinheimera sp. KL1]KOO57938.1 hypothetical protein WH43_12705 [Rheinheimera sp. KL1]